MVEPLPTNSLGTRLRAALRGMVRDPLVRRFIVATLFAAAFVWVAVDSFRVPTETVRRYFLLSVALIVIMIVAALVVALVVRLVAGRRRRR